MDEGFLTVREHRHDGAGLRYVYPVVSRRAGGLSIGINLNVNQACNWACVYCQVQNLRRGGPPPVDLDGLERELDFFVEQVVSGDYLQRRVAEDCRRLADVAFSGEGEPTSAAEFGAVVERVGGVLARHGLRGRLPVRLITNGSLTHRPAVQAGLAALAAMGGEAWFKLDRADAAGRWQTNRTRQGMERAFANLAHCAARVPTWIQTCWFARRGHAPDEAARRAYLDFIRRAKTLILGIHLYGLARVSQQAGAGELAQLPQMELVAWGERIETETGVRVCVSP
ncbi:MAG: radical SAM protein [Zoogloeaceae bacterium]|jgi:wyosine [tRNA(Phe)-imidazoG37] synthetase (radical SAM superfamily)|nr:radical SAM protein [Zoogloeaceae bacterium]